MLLLLLLLIVMVRGRRRGTVGVVVCDFTRTGLRGGVVMGAGVDVVIIGSSTRLGPTTDGLVVILRLMVGRGGPIGSMSCQRSCSGRWRMLLLVVAVSLGSRLRSRSVVVAAVLKVGLAAFQISAGLGNVFVLLETGTVEHRAVQLGEGPLADVRVVPSM